MIEILNIYVSQMQRLSIVFKSDIEDGDYTVDIDDEIYEISNLKTILVESETVYIALIDDFTASLNQTYNFKLIEASNEEEEEESDEFTAEITLIRNIPETIQQSVYDILTANTLADSFGREVSILENGLNNPDNFDTGVNTSKTPFIIIDKPVIIRTEPVGLKMLCLTHRLEIDLCDSEVEDNPTNVDHLYDLAKDIIFILMAKEDLNLCSAGIPQNAIEYSFSQTAAIDNNDKLNTVTISLQITQYKSV